ncbi:MAG TPA: hypothetical protein VKG87_01870, partial [Terriglobales bacterium]|nr:hypothetical protein [Terriglobales bacterium]
QPTSLVEIVHAFSLFSQYFSKCPPGEVALSRGFEGSMDVGSATPYNERNQPFGDRRECRSS